MGMANMTSRSLLVLISVFQIVVGYEDKNYREEVRITPYDIEVNLKQEITMTCNTQAFINNCTWKFNGILKTELPVIDNWEFNMDHFGRCQITVKVTRAEVGECTCYVFTEESSEHPRNASTQISLITRIPKRPHGLYATLCIGLVLFVGYTVGFTTQYMCERKVWSHSTFATATPLTHQTSAGFNYGKHNGSISDNSEIDTTTNMTVHL